MYFYISGRRVRPGLASSERPMGRGTAWHQTRRNAAPNRQKSTNRVPWPGRPKAKPSLRRAERWPVALAGGASRRPMTGARPWDVDEGGESTRHGVGACETRAYAVSCVGNWRGAPRAQPFLAVCALLDSRTVLRHGHNPCSMLVLLLLSKNPMFFTRVACDNTLTAGVRN